MSDQAPNTTTVTQVVTATPVTKAAVAAAEQLVGQHGCITPGEGTTDSLRLPALTDRTLAHRIAQEGTIDDLLKLERDIQLELERVEALVMLMAAAKRLGGSREDLARVSRAVGQAARRCSIAVMSQIKAVDRTLEEAWTYLNAFLVRSGVYEVPRLRRFIHIANLAGEELFAHPDIARPTHLAPLAGVSIVDRTYTLIVGVKVGSRAAVDRIGRIAGAHGAKVVAHADHSFIDPRFRRTSLGEQVRMAASSNVGRRADLREMRKPLEEDHLEVLRGLVGNMEGCEHVVVVVNLVKVRRATSADADDVAVPLSCEVGGRTFFQAAVSREHSVMSSGSAARLANAIRECIDAPSDNAGDPGPLVFDFDGLRMLLPDLPLVVGVESDLFGHDGETLVHLEGMHVARGTDPEYQLGVQLLKAYLRRVLMKYGRFVKGEAITDAEKIRHELHEALKLALVGPEPDKPCSSADVLLDTTSPDGRRVRDLSGLRFIVKLEPKFGVEFTSWVIMTKDGRGIDGRVYGEDRNQAA